MKIVKKDFKVQEFSLAKLERSISNACDDAKEPMTASDINNVAKDVLEDIMKIREDLTSVHEVFALTLAHLQNEGFKKVADFYYKGKSID